MNAFYLQFKKIAKPVKTFYKDELFFEIAVVVNLIRLFSLNAQLKNEKTFILQLNPVSKTLVLFCRLF